MEGTNDVNDGLNVTPQSRRPSATPSFVFEIGHNDPTAAKPLRNLADDADNAETPIASTDGLKQRRLQSSPSATNINKTSPMIESGGAAMEFPPEGFNTIPLKRTRTKSEASTTKKMHPIVAKLISTYYGIIDSKSFRWIVGHAAEEYIQISWWLSVLVLSHATITTIFIISLQTVMPGIWVYNFIQLFVILCVGMGHYSSERLSKIIKLSMASTDLLKGNVMFAEISDFFVQGPKAPAHKVIQTSTIFQNCSQLLLVACSIFFTWEAEMSDIIKNGDCIAPKYENASLPLHIDLQQYLEGDSDFAAIYHYAMPLQDGVIGGWGGWPLHSPAAEFWVSRDGPIFYIQVDCDHGAARPDITEYGLAASVSGKVVSIDNQGFMIQATVIVPPDSMIDDRTGELQSTTFLQHCSVFVNTAYAKVTFRFTADEWDTIAGPQLVSITDKDNLITLTSPGTQSVFLKDVNQVFESQSKSLEANGVTVAFDLIFDAVMQTTLNATYYPSQGGSLCNYLWWATSPDGYYHTNLMYRGLATGIAATSHFALMQYNRDVSVPCRYQSMQGSGRLVIPNGAVVAAATGSTVAILVKLFEILWWALSRTGKEENHGYKRARRSLRHPVRFAMDAAQMLGEGMDCRENGDDVCDTTTDQAIICYGKAKIRYGEDVETVNLEDRGHLRVAQLGKTTSVKEDRLFGSLQESHQPELDEFFWK
ncbi:UNVERIFIED_CONTAM: hypothetical protein HDU68_001451 [Siphonaria sp. JEL0065]|nr:hypothetical protein HDU68_001451 [Siphonaria sp. JEL0065]